MSELEGVVDFYPQIHLVSGGQSMGCIDKSFEATFRRSMTTCVLKISEIKGVVDFYPHIHLASRVRPSIGCIAAKSFESFSRVTFRWPIASWVPKMSEIEGVVDFWISEYRTAANFTHMCIQLWFWLKGKLKFIHIMHKTTHFWTDELQVIDANFFENYVLDKFKNFVFCVLWGGAFYCEGVHFSTQGVLEHPQNP